MKLYFRNNRSFILLSKDEDFQKLLDHPSNDTKTASLILWSYIADCNATGSDKNGWTYTVNMKSRMEEFLNVAGIKKYSKENDHNTFESSQWDSDHGLEYKTTIGSKTYTFTCGEEVNLRYLDLLMTLKALSNKGTYWIDGIKNYMTENKGYANISITQGIVARMATCSTKGGSVKPATVFASCNDLCQVAYNVKKAYNISDVGKPRDNEIKKSPSKYVTNEAEMS